MSYYIMYNTISTIFILMYSLLTKQTKCNILNKTPLKKNIGKSLTQEKNSLNYLDAWESSGPKNGTHCTEELLLK